MLVVLVSIEAVRVRVEIKWLLQEGLHSTEVSFGAHGLKKGAGWCQSCRQRHRGGCDVSHRMKNAMEGVYLSWGRAQREIMIWV